MLVLKATTLFGLTKDSDNLLQYYLLLMMYPLSPLPPHGLVPPPSLNGLLMYPLPPPPHGLLPPLPPSHGLRRPLPPPKKVSRVLFLPALWALRTSLAYVLLKLV